MVEETLDIILDALQSFLYTIDYFVFDALGYIQNTVKNLFLF